MGVIFRTLLFVNGTMFIVIVLRSSDFQVALLEFIESSMLVEWACLLSLFVMCGARQVFAALGSIVVVPAGLQRVASALVPAAVTGSIIYFLNSFEWFMVSFNHLILVKGMVCAGLFGLLLQHYFELRARAFSPALMEARLQALQARIRPHFLFNSLNAVLSLIRTEPLRAEAALEDLADLFRVVMRDARVMTSLEKEIHLCRQYLSIEKIRLGERLQVQWDLTNISERVLCQAQVPAMLLQPLLENAVHYGAEPARGVALIRVRITRSIDRIEVMVVNPQHAGRTAVGGNQMALNNIRERLALLYDVEAQLSANVVDGHFEVKLRFPYVKMTRKEAAA